MLRFNGEYRYSNIHFETKAYMVHMWMGNPRACTQSMCTTYSRMLLKKSDAEWKSHTACCWLSVSPLPSYIWIEHKSPHVWTIAARIDDGNDGIHCESIRECNASGVLYLYLWSAWLENNTNILCLLETIGGLMNVRSADRAAFLVFVALDSSALGLCWVFWRCGPIVIRPLICVLLTLNDVNDWWFICLITFIYAI